MYRGTQDPGARGVYLFTDNCDGTIRLLAPDGRGGVSIEGFRTRRGVGVELRPEQRGALYVLSLAGGLYRIDAA